MRFLTDEWLADVATGYAGKCTIIAATMMILERALLPERPVVFVTAGHRGGGKTTTLKMIVMAAAGLPAVGAAWSNDPEERRKALFTYLDPGVQTRKSLARSLRARRRKVRYGHPRPLAAICASLPYLPQKTQTIG